MQADLYVLHLRATNQLTQDRPCPDIPWVLELPKGRLASSWQLMVLFLQRQCHGHVLPQGVSTGCLLRFSYSSPLLRLSRKYCVVAGAGSGIGLAAVEAFLEASAAGVAMLYNSNDKTIDLAKELEKKFNGNSRVIALKCPVNDPKAVADVTQKVVDEFGRIDVYVSSSIGGSLEICGRCQV